MRDILRFASAGAFVLGLAGPALIQTASAQSATTPTKSGPEYNTSGPGADNGSNPGAQPLSGTGPAPSFYRHNPGSGSATPGPATTATDSGSGFNTGGPAATNSTNPMPGTVGAMAPSPSQQTGDSTFANSGNDKSGTAPSTSTSGYNTSGPAATNTTRPGATADGSQQ
jgi:hypothetical protein